MADCPESSKMELMPSQVEQLVLVAVLWVIVAVLSFRRALKHAIECERNAKDALRDWPRATVVHTPSRSCPGGSRCRPYLHQGLR